SCQEAGVGRLPGGSDRGQILVVILVTLLVLALALALVLGSAATGHLGLLRLRRIGRGPGECILRSVPQAITLSSCSCFVSYPWVMVAQCTTCQWFAAEFEGGEVSVLSHLCK